MTADSSHAADTLAPFISPVTASLRTTCLLWRNVIAVAVTCGIGVYLWSWSAGLVVVIAVSMIIAMVVAGFAGAVIPLALTRFGQDPATSSSIILTTVSDIAGFLSFLGIAALMLGMI